MPGGVPTRRGMFSVARIYHSLLCALPCQPQPRRVRPSRGAASWTELAHDWTAMTGLTGDKQDGAPFDAEQRLDGRVTILEMRMRSAVNCPWADLISIVQHIIDDITPIRDKSGMGSGRSKRAHAASGLPPARQWWTFTRSSPG